MPVIYESPLTVLCDSPAHYRNQSGIEFYRGLPTVWDETVVLSAELARHVVIARRSGQRWYVAAMNGENPARLKAALSFLGKGNWTLRQFADAPKSDAQPELLTETSRDVVSSDVLDLSLASALK
jgi:alpha-glucosidase